MSDPNLLLTEENIKKFAPNPVNGLTNFDIKGLANYIKTGHCKKIIFVQGAGLSVAAGIPDFRTPGTGLYSNLQKYDLPFPEAVFSIDYFQERPEPFFQLAKETMPGNYKPTLAHYLPVLFARQGLLQRVYTQNIDGLERVAGLNPELLVECHGTYFTGHCRKCKAEYKFDDFKDFLLRGEIPHCTQTADCDGIIKPDIVFFGEALPSRFFDLLDDDFDDCDLLIVIGTSLAVSPVNGLVGQVKKDTVRVLINNEKVCCGAEKLSIIKDGDNYKLVNEFESKNSFSFGQITNRRDVFLGGDCQTTVYNLVKELGMLDEFLTMVPDEIAQKYDTK